ncbi:MAG: SDR family oxidoreductase [Promethearchaeota archaeon]|jgi:NAD(P)-dependent dehydrogenase (short-subunit alcohol dehydrogenase family)
MPEHNKGAVLITGASTGIGKACALLLDRSGYKVFAGVRKTQVGKELQAEASERLTPVILDITKAEQIAGAVEAIKEALGANLSLAGLVNNAGIAVPGPIEYLPIDFLRQQLEVNVIGHIAVTQAFLPLIRKGQGRIVNTSSAIDRFALPFLGTYCASKFAMEVFTDSLRRELLSWNIHVSIVKPGLIETPMWEKSYAVADAIEAELPPQAKELYTESFATGIGFMEKLRHRRASPPEAVAKAVRRCLEARRPKSRYLVGAGARLPKLIATFVPDRLADWGVRKVLGV